MPDTLNILFLAAEAVPFVQVGGLADVAGSLPLALRALTTQSTGGVKLDVRLVIPFHNADRVESTPTRLVAEFQVQRNNGSISTQVYETVLDGMTVYFIKGAPFSEATSVYSSDLAQDREKYGFFSLAVLEMAKALNLKLDILHANDWHTALALYALRSRGAGPLQPRVRTMLTLHNLPYTGGDGADVLEAYRLPPLPDESLPKWARTHPLPLGLWAADAIIPVSPTYAGEILTPEFGCGLESYLRLRREDLTGILNGLDTASWDPVKDRDLTAPFTSDDLSGRAVNRSALRKQLNLPDEPFIPILAMIGRLDPQKGVDITLKALSLTADLPWQFVLLGRGDLTLERATRELEARFPDRVRVITRFDAPLGRLIYGGADLFLMPSRYEPCGLAQMIAMRYGCVPVVRATGGLKDTVQVGKTGFRFEEAAAEAMAEAIRQALAEYNRPEEWKQYQINGMKKDFSWRRSARQYARIYRSLTSCF